MSVFGFPEEYKGLKIYPVKLKDSQRFLKSIGCLILNKNQTPDPEIIKMSYLKFLVFVIANFDQEFWYLLNDVLQISLQAEKIDIQITTEGKVFLLIENKKISEQDFENIRKIILKQNLIPIQEILDPQLEKRIQEAREFLRRKQNPATFEERIIAYHCKTGMLYEDIANLTLYQFEKGLERMNLISEYEICKTAEMSGFVKFKGEIPHWLSHIKECGIFEDVSMTKEDFEKMTADEDMFAK